MNRSYIMVVAFLALCACTASDASAQTRYGRAPRGYHVVPQYRYYTPRYQPLPRYPAWGGPRSLNVTTPGGFNMHLNPYNGRGSVNFRGIRIGF